MKTKHSQVTGINVSNYPSAPERSAGRSLREVSVRRVSDRRRALELNRVAPGLDCHSQDLYREPWHTGQTGPATKPKPVGATALAGAKHRRRVAREVVLCAASTATFAALGRRPLRPSRPSFVN